MSEKKQLLSGNWMYLHYLQGYCWVFIYPRAAIDYYLQMHSRHLFGTAV